MESPLRLFLGHHKCATTWINSILFQVCSDLALKFFNATNPGMFESDIQAFTNKERIDFLAFTNANYAYLRNIEHFRGFHVIRDPRDIVVSAFFSHTYSHSTEDWPALVEHRKKLKRVSKDEGLMLEIKFNRPGLERLYTWNYTNPNILEIRMEEMISHPYETMLAAMTHLDMVKDDRSYRSSSAYLLGSVFSRLHTKSRGMFPFRSFNKRIPAQFLLGYVYQNRFSSKTSGREPGQEDAESHYRKGVAGDWVNHFNGDHKRYFKDQYNELLLKLGYEDSPDW
ncbi:MAG: sulfotransferase [Chloroflexota bacterium]|nr:sulfotransferase [Chloroflexota bacterium]